MSPETQAPSSRTDFSYPLNSLTYVDPTVDQSQERFELYGNPPSATFAYKVVKRGFDICVTLFISPFVVGVGLLVAFLIVIDSPGPVFFSHRRIGRENTYFSMWKFRTMCRNGEEVLEQHFVENPRDRDEWRRNHKLKNDPRVSPLGAFLRRTSLDELPQIWNVLTGDMSLVGPRPIVYEEIVKYGSDFVYYAAVKPGITGLWQTSGRSTLSYAARVSLDRFYVENWSFAFELRILMRTIRSVISSDGAY